MQNEKKNHPVLHGEELWKRTAFAEPPSPEGARCIRIKNWKPVWSVSEGTVEQDNAGEVGVASCGALWVRYGVWLLTEAQQGRK